MESLLFRRRFGAMLALLLVLTIAGCTHPPNKAYEGYPLSPPASSPVHFSDVAASAGLNYQWTIAGKRPLNILQTIGNGCAFLDYNNDGNLDILLIGPKLALYQGDGKGHFTDATHVMGLDKLHGHFLGCAVGDYDADGYDDLYISGYRTGVLLHNEKGKGFKDVTQAMGLTVQPWGTSCAFADVDGDGKLDLFIGNYVEFGPNQPQLCKAGTGALMTSCGPRYYQPEHGVLYRNLGGHFQNVTQQWGVQKTSGKVLGVAFTDLDGSLRPSLSLANDEVAGDLLQNSRTTFKNIGATSSTAYDENGSAHGGMGEDWGDYNNDGKPDLVVATFQREAKCIYKNDGKGLFEEQSAMLGMGDKGLPYVSFGVKWFDCDNDGWEDLIFASGHVQDNIHAIDSSADYRNPLMLLHNDSGTHFSDLSNQAGPDLQKTIVGRGLATGDFDNDGRVDVLVVDSEGKPLLLHNETTGAGHWLGVNLVGTKSNRDGYGATLIATVSGRTITRQCQSDGSYLSASDRRVHFGLGTSAVVDTLKVVWPSGHTDVFSHIPADHYVTLREGSPKVQ